MDVKVKTSLRIILIGVTVLPLVILALVASLQIFGYSTNMTANETLKSGEGYSAGVINIVSGYMDDAKTLAAMSAVERSVTDLNSVKSDIDSIRASMKNNRGGILDVVVIGPAGNIISAEGSASNAYFFAYGDSWSAKQNAFATNLYTAGASGYGTDVFATVSKIGETGYVACVVDASVIGDFLSKCTYSNNGFICVTDTENVIGAHGTVMDFASSGLNDSIKGQIAQASDDGSSSLNDSAFIGTFGKVTGTDWIWLSLYSSSDASANVSGIFVFSMIVIAVLCGVCVVVMIGATRGVINPMLKMVSTMKDINAGDHDQRIDTSNMGREFGRISETFNDMMDEAILSEELHKTVSDLSDNMLFEYDFAKEVMFVSNNFKDKIGLAVNGATLNNGKFIDSMMSEDDAEKYKRDMNTLLKNKDDIGGEYEIKDAKGQSLWVAIRAHCITDRLGEILRVIGVLTDINSEKNASLKLAERASYDFLSQLYNRNTFEREFKSELERNTNKKIAILFLDVDDFKFINDRYNHAVGDEVIRYVADTIKTRAGETGFAGRFGGDEFVLCVSDPKMIENVEVLSMDIIDDLYSGYYSKSVDTTLNIKASIGIAIYPVHAKDSRTLIACADTAMYFVKKNGKANYHIYDPSDEETTMGAHTL